LSYFAPYFSAKTSIATSAEARFGEQVNLAQVLLHVIMPQGWYNGQPWQLLRAPARAKPRSGRRNRLSNRTKKLTKKKDGLPCLNFLTKKAPYKGLGADSEEKREPVSDIDTAVVDSLKVLDLKWPIREADIRCRVSVRSMLPVGPFVQWLPKGQLPRSL